LDTYLLNKVNL